MKKTSNKTAKIERLLVVGTCFRHKTNDNLGKVIEVGTNAGQGEVKVEYWHPPKVGSTEAYARPMKSLVVTLAQNVAEFVDLHVYEAHVSRIRKTKENTPPASLDLLNEIQMIRIQNEEILVIVQSLHRRTCV